MRVQLTYQPTLVQEVSVSLDVEWLAEAVGLTVDELLGGHDRSTDQLDASPT
jgi:hypothetical protein